MKCIRNAYSILDAQDGLIRRSDVLSKFGVVIFFLFALLF